MLLEARAVTKAFGSFKAVDAASVTLEQGDILGLIGPNGAGKSDRKSTRLNSSH